MGDLEELVHEFETVMSWHTGPRRAKLENLIARLREHAGMEPAAKPDTTTDTPTAGSGAGDGSAAAADLPNHTSLPPL